MTDVSLDEPAGLLPLAAQQLVVLARAIVRNPKILILDEVTAALDFADRESVFSLMRALAGEGCLILFITHRMDEVMSLSDRISILRGGRVVRTEERGASTPAETAARRWRHARRRSWRMAERAIFAASPFATLSLRPAPAPITQAIAPGEIVGLAGLDGHGQELFLKMLAGLAPPLGGSIELGLPGAPRKITGFRKAVASGIAYLPRDRRANGIFPTQSVLDNFAVSTLSRDTRLGLISPAARKARYDIYRERLSIVAPRPDAPITTLSGGNQQKVLLARALALEPAHPASQRPDARRRRGDAACALRRLSRTGDRRHGAGHPVQRDRGDSSAVPSRAGVPRKRRSRPKSPAKR